MTDRRTEEDTKPRNPKDFKKPFLTWIEISCILSATIIAWAFSSAFFGRQDPIVSTRAAKNATPSAAIRPVKSEGHQNDQQQLHQQQLSELMVLDDQLMKQAAQITRRQYGPGEKESRRYREKREAILREQADLLLSELPDGEIVEGTMEWEALQDMKTTLDDYHH